jgi:hypothetical protein
MPKEDFSAKLDALKKLSTLLAAKKEAPPPELFKAAGLPVTAKVKDVNNAIASTKKLVSLQTKEKEREEEEAEGLEEDEPTGKGFLKQTQKKESEKGGGGRQQGRDKKMLQNSADAGDMDLVEQRVGDVEDD